LLFLSLFNILSAAINGIMIMNYELRKAWKEVITDYFKILYSNYVGHSK